MLIVCNPIVPQDQEMGLGLDEGKRILYKQ